MPYARQTLRLLLALWLTAAMAFDSHKALAQDKRKPVVITKEQAKARLKRISNRGVTVFYPNYVPARFSLVSAKTVPDSECPNLDYNLEFCDKKRLCFSIESACGGIGSGPEGDKTLTGKSRFFGRFHIYRFNPGSDGNDTTLVYYLSDWMSDQKMVVAEKKGLSPSRTGGRYHHFLGHGVTDKEALAIVESLMPIR